MRIACAAACGVLLQSAALQMASSPALLPHHHTPLHRVLLWRASTVLGSVPWGPRVLSRQPARLPAAGLCIIHLAVLVGGVRA